MTPPNFLWLRGLLGPRIAHLAWRDGRKHHIRMRGQGVVWIAAVCGQRAVAHMPEVADTTRCPDCARWAAELSTPVIT